jgi:hypothetical protein
MRRTTATRRAVTAGPVRDVESYLAAVAAGLAGPARARQDILAELRAGLLDDIDMRCRAGLAAGQAATAAIAGFGDPRVVAAAFGPELAARGARRVGLTLLVTGPLVGTLWTVAALASHLGIRHLLPWQPAGAPRAWLVILPLAAAAITVTAWAAVLTVAATGRATRWLPPRPRLAPTTAAVAGLSAATADVIVFALLASVLVTAPRGLAPVPVAVAAAASLARLTLARRAARRCLAARAALR